MKVVTRILGPTFVVAWLLAAPGVAGACAVCMSGREDETRLAFILTTAFLTFLPLLLVGGFVWWLRRRARELDRAGARLPAAGPMAPLSRPSA